MQFFWKHLHSNKGDENVSKLIWIVIAFVIGALMLSTLSVAFKTDGVIDNWLNDSIESWFGEPENRDGSTGGSGAGGSGPSGGGNNGENPGEITNASLENIVMQYDASIGALTTDNDKNNGTSYTALFTDLSLNSVYEASAYRSTEGSNTVGSSFLLGNTTGIINQSEVSAQYKDMFKEGTKVITAEDPSGNTYYIGVDEDGNVICPMPNNPVNDGEYVVFTAEDKTPIVLTWNDANSTLMSSGKDYTDMFKGLTEGLSYAVTAYPSASNGSNVDETNSVIGEEYAVAEPAVDPYQTGTMMLKASNGVTTGVDTSGNILVMKAARPSTGNAVYSQGTEGFENVEIEEPKEYNDNIPSGGFYYTGISNSTTGDYTNASAVYTEGDSFPSPAVGDIFVYGDYEYRYGKSVNPDLTWYNTNGWGVRVLDETKESYGPILEKINNRDVKSISNAFYNCKNLIVTPSIPDSVSSLTQAFVNCESLTTVTSIPVSTFDMSRAFKGCKNLVNVPSLKNATSLYYMDATFNGCTSLINAPEIPASVTSFSSAFSDCENLINPPDISNLKITSLSFTFSNCKSLTKAPVIPIGVTDLSQAFRGCASLVTAPSIPDGVTNMSSAFNGCKSLSKAPVIPSTVTNLSYAFLGCTSLTEAPVILNNVTNMWGSFSGCTSLTQAPVIPSSVTNMREAFSGCTSLTGTITINSSSITNATNLLLNNNNNIVVKVPAGSTTYTTISSAGLPANITIQTF